jgi:hypothetical protein
MLSGRTLVGVHVGSRATVLEVTVALVLSLTGDANGGTTVGNTVAELIPTRGLVVTSHALLVAGAVDGDVLHGLAWCTLYNHRMRTCN